MDIICEAFQRFSGKLALSFNGGKDNMVVLDMVSKYLNDHPSEKISVIYIKEEEFTELKDHFDEMVKKYRISPIILDNLENMKESHPHIEAIFMGTKRTDPKGRELYHFSKTTEGWPDYTLINPILDFSYKQVWDYIRQNNIPVCSLYHNGYTSLGHPNKTSKNPKLKHNDIYLPAWMLEDDKDERLGRQ